MAVAETKTCLRCRQLLPADSFHRDKNRRDGRYPYCRACHSSEVKARCASAEWKAHKKEYDRARYIANRAAVIAYSKAAYLKNPERVKRRATAWVKSNPERRQLIAQSYKHRRRSVERKGMGWRELREWKAARPKICHWCGVKCARGYVVDHVKPLSKGGKHEAHNLAISCRSCNARKAARDPIEFAQSIGKLL